MPPYPWPKNCEEHTETCPAINARCTRRLGKRLNGTDITSNELEIFTNRDFPGGFEKQTKNVCCNPDNTQFEFGPFYIDAFCEGQ